MANNLKKAIKHRTALRGWVTRHSDTLKALIEQKPPCSLVELSDSMEQFDSYMSKLDEAQSDVEVLIADEFQLNEDVQNAADFRDNARKPRIRATALYQTLNSATNGRAPSTSSAPSVTSPEAKLPKITLPKFGGEVLQWESFWDIFKATVDDTDLTDVTKLTYLKASLEGDALRAIAGISLTSDNYASVLAILKERYGRKERIIFSHVNQLLSLQIPNKCTISALRTLNDTLLSHTRALENLGIAGSQYGVILTPLILSRLPLEVRLEWSREAEGKESDLDFLLDFLKKEVQRRDRSLVIKDNTSSSQSTTQAAALTESKKPPPTAAALTIGTNASASSMSASRKPANNAQSRSCGICAHRHFTSRCWKLTREPDLSSRVHRVQEAKLCFMCLQPQHSEPCTVNCAKCGGAHHAVLCSAKKPATPVSNTPLTVHTPAPAQQPTPAHSTA